MADGNRKQTDHTFTDHGTTTTTLTADELRHRAYQEWQKTRFFDVNDGGGGAANPGLSLNEDGNGGGGLSIRRDEGQISDQGSDTEELSDDNELSDGDHHDGNQDQERGGSGGDNPAEQPVDLDGMEPWNFDNPGADD